MARPPAKELTERELEVMHVFWTRGESTVADVRDVLAESGLDRAYTTIATLVRILTDKGFLVQTNEERPFSYRPAQIVRGGLAEAPGRRDRPGLPGLPRALARTAHGTEGALGAGAEATRGAAAGRGEAEMNIVESSLLEGAIRATAFALAGIMIYLIMRRWSPAAGSLTAASTLVLMGVVSLLALCPWPRWGPVLPIAAAPRPDASRRSRGARPPRRGSRAIRRAPRRSPP